MNKHRFLCFCLLANIVLCSCNTSNITSWYYNKINADVLKEQTKNRDAIVGIIDSGINEKFKRFFSKDTIVNGYDFVDDDDEPYVEFNLHGSYISYLIAGNGIDGLSGIDNRLHIMPVRVFDDSGNTDEELVCKGVKYALDNGCNVINMSFASSKYNSKLESIINENGDVVFVASAGDFSATGLSYPAKYDNVIAVSAVDQEGLLYKYSNNASSDESIYAPGVDLPVISVNINEQVIKTVVSGSSYATAIVSAVIGSSILSDKLNKDNLKSRNVYSNGYLDCMKFIS